MVLIASMVPVRPPLVAHVQTRMRRRNRSYQAKVRICVNGLGNLNSLTEEYDLETRISTPM